MKRGKNPAKELEENYEKHLNQNYRRWINIDGLLTSRLLGTMNDDILSLIDGETAYEVWTTTEEQLLPVKLEMEGT